MATYPLLYRMPTTFHGLVSGVRYVVFFRTRGFRIKHSSLGTQAGTIYVGDSLSAADALFMLSGSPPRCYVWGAAGTPALKRAEIGEKVSVEFRLRNTGVQRRRVTLREAPRDLSTGGPDEWYHSGLIGQQLYWIGCGKV